MPNVLGNMYLLRYEGIRGEAGRVTPVTSFRSTHYGPAQGLPVIAPGETARRRRELGAGRAHPSLWTGPRDALGSPIVPAQSDPTSIVPAQRGEAPPPAPTKPSNILLDSPPVSVPQQTRVFSRPSPVAPLAFLPPAPAAPPQASPAPYPSPASPPGDNAPPSDVPNAPSGGGGGGGAPDKRPKVALAVGAAVLAFLYLGNEEKKRKRRKRAA